MDIGIDFDKWLIILCAIEKTRTIYKKDKEEYRKPSSLGETGSSCYNFHVVITVLSRHFGPARHGTRFKCVCGVM